MLGRTNLFSKRSGSFGREDGVILSGYLTGNMNKSWKKRYFELNSDHTLSYYKNKVSGGNLSKKEELKLGTLTLDPLNTIVEICHEKEKSSSSSEELSSPSTSSFHSNNNNNNTITASPSSTSSGSGGSYFGNGSIFFNAAQQQNSQQQQQGKSASEIVVSPQIYDVKKMKEEKDYMLNSKMIQCIYRERYRKQRSFRKDRKQSVFARISRSYQETPLSNGFSNIFSSGSSASQLTTMTTSSSTSYFFLKKVKKYKFSITVGNSQSGGKIFKDRKYTLYCETEEERDMWIKGIISSIEKQVKAQIRKPYTFESARQYSKFLTFIGDESQEMIIHALNDIRSPVQESFLVAWMVVMDCFSFHKSCIALVKAAIKVELELTKHPETLFRRNSISTKLVQLFFKIHGQVFLKSTLQQLIAKVCIADEYLEIEESRLREFLRKELDDIDHPEKPTGEIIDQIISSRQQRNKTRIIDLSKQFLDRIISNTINEGPFEICEILEFTYEESKRLFPESAEIAVGGLFFLRFICPAIISPHLQGILSFQPQSNSQRTLTLTTKVIQNIANQVYENNTKEEYMSLVSDFVTSHIESTKEFIRDISNLDQDAKKFEKSKRLTMRFGESNSDLELNCYHVIHEFFRTTEEGKKFNTSNPQLFKFYTQMLDSLNEDVKSELNVKSTTSSTGTPQDKPIIITPPPSIPPPEIKPKTKEATTTITTTATTATSPNDSSKRRRGATKLTSGGHEQETSPSSSDEKTTSSRNSPISVPGVLNFDRLSISESSLATSRRRRGGMHTVNVQSPADDNFGNQNRESFSGPPVTTISQETENAISQQIDSPRKVNSPRKEPSKKVSSSSSVIKQPSLVQLCNLEETSDADSDEEDLNSSSNDISLLQQMSKSSRLTTTKTDDDYGDDGGDNGDDGLERVVVITSLRNVSNNNGGGEYTPLNESDEAFTSETPNELEDRALLEQIINTSRITTTSIGDTSHVIINESHHTDLTSTNKKKNDQLSESSTDDEEDEEEEDEEVSFHLLEIFGKGEELSEEEFIHIVLKFIEESAKEIISECNANTTSVNNSGSGGDSGRIQFLLKSKFIISLIAMFSLRLKPEKGVWQLLSNLCSLSENESLINVSNQLVNDFMEFKQNNHHSELDGHQLEYICFCSFMCRAINNGTLFETLTYLLNVQELDLILSEYYAHESDYDSNGYELDNIDLLSFPIIHTKSAVISICERLSTNLSKIIPHRFTIDTSLESCNLSFM